MSDALRRGRVVLLSVGLVAVTLPMSGLAISDFLDRVNEYVEVHQKLERAAPKLPTEATPQQIDQTQRALAAGIQSARVGARRGDIFTPDMTTFIKRLLNRVFAGPEGWQLRSTSI